MPTTTPLYRRIAAELKEAITSSPGPTRGQLDPTGARQLGRQPAQGASCVGVPFKVGWRQGLQPVG